MCGRFTLRSRLNQLLSELHVLEFASEIQPRYNIAPTQDVFAVRAAADGQKRECVPLRWGLVPSWAKDLKIANSLINARSETIAEKPSFRTAFKKRRCVILADGYYEWKKNEENSKGTKQPFYIRMKSNEPFAMAGLWEYWRGNDAESPPLETCTIITTDANEVTSSVHHRMPVILTPHDCNTWLDHSQQGIENLKYLLQPYDPEPMMVEPVSTQVNNPRNQGPFV